MTDEFAWQRQRYSTCMRGAGYTIKNANEVVALALDVAVGDTHAHDYPEGSPERAKAIEQGIVNQRLLAVADVRCRLAQAEAITDQLSPVLDSWLSLHQADVDKVAAKWVELG